MDNLAIAAVLDRAADRCVRGWCQGAFAVDANGREASTVGSAACRWCAAGSVHAEAREEWEETVPAVESFLARRNFHGGLVAWNDSGERTQSEVVATLRACAASLRETGTDADVAGDPRA